MIESGTGLKSAAERTQKFTTAMQKIADVSENLGSSEGPAWLNYEELEGLEKAELIRVVGTIRSLLTGHTIPTLIEKHHEMVLQNPTVQDYIGEFEDLAIDGSITAEEVKLARAPFVIKFPEEKSTPQPVVEQNNQRPTIFVDRMNQRFQNGEGQVVKLGGKYVWATFCLFLDSPEGFVSPITINQTLAASGSRRRAFGAPPTVNHLRKLLGDNLTDPKIITQTGTGRNIIYRLEADIQPLELPEEEPTERVPLVSLPVSEAKMQIFDAILNDQPPLLSEVIGLFGPMKNGRPYNSQTVFWGLMNGARFLFRRVLAGEATEDELIIWHKVKKSEDAGQDRETYEALKLKITLWHKKQRASGN